ncbi:MAG: UDP-glucose 4-epimerase GalE [Spirochaetaceae bacterium]|jgi:UDP-glucose 4-epimerase|nr:UDP-glucose 4-epimerase GalE [Spirochaetaceae bacterium]
MRNILVTGGAGYIGSHVVRNLDESGYNTIVLDNLSEGHREACPRKHIVEASIGDRAALDAVFAEHHIDAVMHFSAYAYVGESVADPEKYYLNNVSATLALLETMRQHGVNRFIFSSSCATYGNPEYTPPKYTSIDENHRQNPVNPYGRTKLIVEQILKDYNSAYGLRFIALRYFNAAGAHPDGSIGESHRIETHLIPLVLQAIQGKREQVSLFGTDYGTPDGTCVRDYIHVCDLARAHRSALELLLNGGESDCINLGTETGCSVRQIIAVCEEVAGKKAPVVECPRRPGDPPLLVAQADKAKKLLSFSPEYTDIREIIKTAWQWEQKRRY